MTSASLNIAIEPEELDEGKPRLRLTLEPEYVEERDNLADFADIDAMFSAAMSGLSARHRQIECCRWAKWTQDGQLVLTLALYVWPSTKDLAYTLKLPEGVSSTPAVPYTRSREWKWWVAGSKSLDLPWRLTNASLRWHEAIGCMDAFSSPVPPPAISMPDEATVEIDESAYGVLVASGTAEGWQHDISISFAKLAGADAMNKVEIERIPVSATWMDADGEQQEERADMAVPECVRELLASCGGKPGLIVKVRDLRDIPPDIYYHGCTGEILLRRRRDTP